MALFERSLTPTVSLAALLAGQSAVGGLTALPSYAVDIASSGFPGIRAAHHDVQEDLLDSYTRNIVDRDLAEADIRIRAPHTLHRWLTAYAAASSTTTAYDRILNTAVGPEGQHPAKATTIAYREHLERIYVLDPVAPSPQPQPLRGAAGRRQTPTR